METLRKIRKKGRIMVSTEQKELIVRAMETDEALANANTNSSDGRLVYKIKWDRLSRRLNLIQGGSKKSINEWQKSWASIKHKVKLRILAEKTTQGRCLNKLERRIARFIANEEFQNTTEPNGYTSSTCSDDFEQNVKFEHPAQTNDPLQCTNDNVNVTPDYDIESSQTPQSKTDESMNLIANLLQRQTVAIERQTEAILRKPTPPAPASNINAAINVISKLLERQTNAIERQTSIIERQIVTTKKQARLCNEYGNSEADMRVVKGLVLRQSKLTQRINASARKNTDLMEKFHGMFTTLLGSLSEVIDVNKK